MQNLRDQKLAFVFPGQGSQSLGMLKELAEVCPLVEETYDEASVVLDYDLWQLVQEGPESALNKTEKTQPALLAGDVAVWRIWRAEEGRLPAKMAGHSLGEYSALVCAEALAFSDAVRLVAMRGRFMQEAVPEGEGGMAAIVGLENEEVAALCAEVAQGEIVAPANFNALGQVVVAGNLTAIHRVITHAKEKGAKLAKLLPMSVPSHCALMEPAAKKLAAYLEEIVIDPPKIPVIQNVDVKSYETASAIKDALVRQLYSPVQWVQTIQMFEKEGIQKIVECGPGKVLTGLNKRISDKIGSVAMHTREQIQETLKDNCP